MIVILSMYLLPPFLNLKPNSQPDEPLCILTGARTKTNSVNINVDEVKLCSWVLCSIFLETKGIMRQKE
jgi:hypothetical protein